MSVAEIILSLEMGMIYGIVAMGIYFTFRVIDFPDLTCDGSFVLGACVSGVMIKAGYNPLLSLLIALLSGAISGVFTGILNTKLKITNLLSGILMAFMLYSINLKIMGGSPNITLMEDVTIFTNLDPLLTLGLICLLVWCLCGYTLSTDFGLALRSIGQNKRVALNGGVNVERMTILGLALGNSLIAFGGGLLSQHQGFVDVGSGVGTIIIGLASLMIGEKVFPFRSPWWGGLACIVGSVIYRLFISFALHSDTLGFETQDLNLITGLLVIGAMVLPRRHLC